MQEHLISVLMSTYNETKEELDLSISSILLQSYRNIELIIIDDNPQNEMLKNYLNGIQDDRVHIYYNEDNLGLVKSLNKALSYANGDIIARMDADDISLPYRLENQLEYLEENALDMLGCNLMLIDEKGQIIRECMRFPQYDAKIRQCMPWGGCIAHPTWMVRTSVYKELGGYRGVPYCEDYDFITRVLSKKVYKVGNLQEIGLKYRIRSSSISNSNSREQYLLRMYIARNRNHICEMKEDDLNAYRGSESYKKDQKIYDKYLASKDEFKNKNKWAIFNILINKYFYLNIIEKLVLRWRERG